MNATTEKAAAPADLQKTQQEKSAATGRPQLALWEISLVVVAVLALVAGFIYQLDSVKAEAARDFDLRSRLVRHYLEGRLAATQALATIVRDRSADGRAAPLAGVKGSLWSLPGRAAADGARQGTVSGTAAPTAAVAREVAAARALDAPAAALLARDSEVAAVSYLSASHFVYRLDRAPQPPAAYADALYGEAAWLQAAPAHNAAGEPVLAGLQESATGLRLQVAAPVVAAGAFLGIVGVELAPDVLQGLMAAGDRPGEIILVDSQGQILARPGAFRRDENYPVPASGINLWDDSDGTAWAAVALDGGRLYLLQRLSLPHYLGAALARSLPLGLLFVLGACAIVLGLRLREALQQLAQQDRRDPLTRALNRRGLFEDAVPLHAVARRNGKGIAVLTLDVDFFRQLNDQFGHDAGDKVLCALTTGLREHVREYDVIGRWSSEIFVVLLMVEHDADALPVAERLRGMAAATVQRDALLAVTASGGLAMWGADEALEAAIGRAEEMLYAAKAGGRDRLQPALDVVRPVYAPSGEQVDADSAQPAQE